MAGFLIATMIKNKYRGLNYKMIFGISLPLLYIIMVLGYLMGVNIPGMTIWLSLAIFGFIMSLGDHSFPKRTGFQLISRYSYGIYLSHFMLISIIIKSGVPSKVPLTVEPFLMAITILTLEVLLMWVLERFRLGKYVM